MLSPYTDGVAHTIFDNLKLLITLYLLGFKRMFCSFLESFTIPLKQQTTGFHHWANINEVIWGLSRVILSREFSYQRSSLKQLIPICGSLNNSSAYL